MKPLILLLLTVFLKPAIADDTKAPLKLDFAIVDTEGSSVVKCTVTNTSKDALEISLPSEKLFSGSLYFSVGGRWVKIIDSKWRSYVLAGAVRKYPTFELREGKALELELPLSRAVEASLTIEDGSVRLGVPKYFKKGKIDVGELKDAEFLGALQVSWRKVGDGEWRGEHLKSALEFPTEPERTEEANKTQHADPPGTGK